MANISFAYGTCYLQAKTKQDILDFIKLHKESERDRHYETNLYPPEDLEDAIQDLEDFYELSMDIDGAGRWTFNYNMEGFFDFAFNKEFEEKEFTDLQEKLKEKEFTAQFEIIDYEGGQGFLSEGEYITTWKDGKSNFDICSESTVDYTAENCRLFEVHDDPYDSEYALKYFYTFMERVKEEYETTKDEDLKSKLDHMLNNPEHTKDQLDDMGMGVYYDFDEFINEFANDYEVI